jgi:serine phosphatase RsbU (regulator of sigma subunit)
MSAKIVFFAKYLVKEFVSPINYVTTFLIGAVINIAQGQTIFFSSAPYVIPLFVQTLSKASVRYKNRELDILSLLPAERKDPVFIIDSSGKIIASKGKTKAFLKRHLIDNIHEVFSADDVKATLELATKNGDSLSAKSFEFYSKSVSKWYQVQVKLADPSSYILVWFDDITLRKALDFSLSAIRKFSGEIISSIDEFIRIDSVYDRVAWMILQEGYQGVLITRQDQKGNLFGYVFKKDQDNLARSDQINISKSSQAPVLDSRKKERIIAAAKSETETQKTFDNTHQFNPAVKGFLKVPITNYINFHEGDVSIIAFNKIDGINKNDFSIMETVVNTARSITYLIELAIGKNRLLSALEVAEEVQQNLLPQNNPNIPGFDIAGASLYCDETGGDYYDFLKHSQDSSGRFSIVVGDVSGHGIEAALLMTTARALIRSEAFHSSNVSQVVNEVNRHLAFDVQDTGRFMTLFYLTCDPANRSLHWIRAGHDPAIFFDPATDTFEELHGPGLALGVDENWQYRENEKTGLAKGQVILIGTDGIWEARNPQGKLFGKAPIHDIIRQSAALSASQILDTIFEAWDLFKQGLRAEDDITLVVIKVDEDI